MNQYPMLAFLSRMGWPFAVLIGLLVMAAIPALFEWRPLAITVGVVAGGGAAIVVKSCLELVHLITDMLLPK